jgi:C4-dicarboxylate transporter DctM subunit
LSNVAVMTNLVVSGISGSATVDAVTSSTLLVPGMRSAGYKPAFAAALNSAAATLGPMMPPSIIMLVYANLAYVSVARLFLAGFLPGLTIAAFLMIYARHHARQHGIQPLPSATWRQRGAATFRAIPALMMPAIIVGGILAGVFTPTEASAVAAAYAILVAMIGVRELSPAGVLRVLSETAVTTGIVMLMVAAANVVSWLLIVNGVGAAIMHLFAPLRGQPWLVLAVINLVLLALGIILEPIPLMMLIVPILLPFVRSLGIDLVHFGIIVTFNTTIALTMPPFGLLMFVSARIAGVSIEAFTREIVPLLVVLLLALAVITYVPALSLWLPRAVL